MSLYVGQIAIEQKKYVAFFHMHLIVPDCQCPLISNSVESNIWSVPMPPVTIGIFALVTLSTMVAEPCKSLPSSRLGPEEKAFVSWLKYHVRGSKLLSSPPVSLPSGKVIHPKYSKQWLSTVAHTIDCVCSRILNHGLDHGLLFSLFKFFGWKNMLS